VYSLGHSANKFFAECRAKNTRQKKTLGKQGVLPSVKTKTLGKEVVCRVLKKYTRQTKIKSFFLKKGEEKNEFFLPSAQI